MKLKQGKTIILHDRKFKNGKLRKRQPVDMFRKQLNGFDFKETVCLAWQVDDIGMYKNPYAVASVFQYGEKS